MHRVIVRGRGTGGGEGADSMMTGESSVSASARSSSESAREPTSAGRGVGSPDSRPAFGIGVVSRGVGDARVVLTVASAERDLERSRFLWKSLGSFCGVVWDLPPLDGMLGRWEGSWGW